MILDTFRYAAEHSNIITPNGVGFITIKKKLPFKILVSLVRFQQAPLAKSPPLTNGGLFSFIHFPFYLKQTLLPLGRALWQRGNLYYHELRDAKLAAAGGELFLKKIKRNIYTFIFDSSICCIH